MYSWYFARRGRAIWVMLGVVTDASRLPQRRMGTGRDDGNTVIFP